MKKLFALAVLVSIGSLSSQAALVGYWNFDDGTANDSSGNGNNGTLQNGATLSGDVANATAGTGSLALAGGNQHVLVPHDPSLTLTSEITISAWVKPAGTGWGAILAKSPSNGGGANHAGNYELRLQNNATHTMQWLYETGPGVNSTVTLNDTSGSNIAVGQWSHIALTMDNAGTYTYYVNGAATGSAVAANPFGQLTNTNPLYLGSRADLFTTISGNLDEIAIWNVALDAAAINDVFTNGVPEPTTALLALLGVIGFVARRRR